MLVFYALGRKICRFNGTLDARRTSFGIIPTVRKRRGVRVLYVAYKPIFLFILGHIIIQQLDLDVDLD